MQRRSMSPTRHAAGWIFPAELPSSTQPRLLHPRRAVLKATTQPLAARSWDQLPCLVAHPFIQHFPPTPLDLTFHQYRQFKFTYDSRTPELFYSLIQTLQSFSREDPNQLAPAAPPAPTWTLQFIHTNTERHTLATPTPVKRASSSSCRLGSKLCSSSIMSAVNNQGRTGLETAPGTPSPLPMQIYMEIKNSNSPSFQ